MGQAQAEGSAAGRLETATGSAGDAPGYGRLAAVQDAYELRGRSSAQIRARRLILLIVALLAVVPAAVVAIRSSKGGVAVRTAVPALPEGTVTFGGIGYRLLGVNAAKTIPQRGAESVTASGLFEIVKLRLQSADRRAHVITSDLLALNAGGIYYSPSSPDDIGLSGPRWGALAPATRVPASGVLTVKAVFDIPAAVLAHHLWLRIGQFDYVGAPPAQVLNLDNKAVCCQAKPPVRPADTIGHVAPSPVIG